MSDELLFPIAIPKLFEGRSAEDAVRVRVPGCSTGEEVFSIAMLLREHLDTVNEQPRVQKPITRVALLAACTEG